jgi:hypothetical protein
MEAKDEEAEDSPEAVEEENDEEAASKVPDERQIYWPTFRPWPRKRKRRRIG